MGWWGPAPPRAYPARIAALARAPFALRKGRCVLWLLGWNGGLVGVLSEL